MILEPLIEQIFRGPCGDDPFAIEVDHTLVDADPGSVLDTIDAVILEPDRLQGQDRQRVGHGWSFVFSNNFSDLPFVYINSSVPVERRALAARRIAKLYANHFQCCAPRLDAIGDGSDGSLGFVCYMLWDIFPLHPGNAEPPVIDAAVDGMFEVLTLDNESCVVGALHGLGHWNQYVNGLGDRVRAATSRRWSRAVREYAEAAASGCVQ